MNNANEAHFDGWKTLARIRTWLNIWILSLLKYSTDGKEFMSFWSQRLNVWISLISKIHVFKLKNQKRWYILIPSISTRPLKDFWFVTRPGFELFWTVSFVRKSQLCHALAPTRNFISELYHLANQHQQSWHFQAELLERTNFSHRGGNEFLHWLAWISLGLH